jgi:DNA-binding NarL/FixJ family response regulator
MAAARLSYDRRMTSNPVSTSAVAGASHLLIVEDHSLMRLALSTLFADDVKVNILEAITLEEALDLYGARRDGIALVLLDLRLPDAHGLSGLRDFLRRFPRAPIAVLSSHNDPVLVSQARALGALAYFSKSDQFDELSRFVQARCLPRLDGGGEDGEEGAGKPDAAGKHRIIETLDGEQVRLTRRQAEVLDYLLAGKSNREIAESVHLAEGTVKHRISDLLLLFNVRSRAQLISRLR